MEVHPHALTLAYAGDSTRKTEHGAGTPGA